MLDDIGTILFRLHIRHASTLLTASSPRSGRSGSVSSRCFPVDGHLLAPDGMCISFSPIRRLPGP